MHINHCLTHLPQRFKSCLTEGWRRSDWVKWREYMLVFRCFKMKCVLFNMLATANTELTAVCESCDMYVDSFTWLWYVHLSQQIRQVFRWVSVPHVVVCVCVCLISFPCDCSVLAEGITQVVSYVLPPTVDAYKYARMSGKMTDCIKPLKRFSCDNQSLFTCIRKCFSLALSIRHVGFVQETLQCSQTAQHVNCFWD